uniref:Uncharacterized protein n=1 Tax=Lygus hesperus TaxID=30085 RepID=A0A0A9XY49_LYGHE
MKTFLLVVLLCSLCSQAVFGLSVQGTLEGTYKPVEGEKQCVPSTRCCCSTGETTIKSTPPNSQIVVSGDLDGGPGCHGFRTLGAIFEPVNATTATWTVPMYGDKYIASANDDYTVLRVERVDIQNTECVNVLHRIQGSATPVDATGLPTSIVNSPLPINQNPIVSTNTPVNSAPTAINAAAGPTITSTTNAGIGSGNFSATGVPVIMQSGIGEGAITPESSYHIKYGLFRTSTISNQYDVWFIIDPASNMFSSIRGSYVYLHYISGTHEDPTRAVVANPITVKMVCTDPTGDMRQYKYSTVYIPADTGIRFSFTYA